MKIGFLSLGCPKNLVDSEVMMGLTGEAGHELTADPAEADVLVVNTCAFIDSAKQESIDAILEMAEHKRTGSCQRLVVTGCLAERYRGQLRAEIPEIDAVLGTGEVPDIVRAIAPPLSTGPAGVPMTLYRGGRGPGTLDRAGAGDHGSGTEVGARTLPTYLYDADTPRRLATPGHFAYLKVAEGCDYACAFCIIPTLRGSYRSRPAESIVREARSLASRGVREIILISQDTTFYGIDRQEAFALPRLLRALNQIDGLEWIRLLYLYPTTVTDDTLAAMSECDKVCKYIDMPLQHASAAVLKRMKRPGTAASYARLLDRIRARVPGVTLRSTFIVGFPGETDLEFAELLDFISDERFDHLGVFTYSHEEGTSAYACADDVPPPVKLARRRRLMALQKRIVSAAQRRRIGERVRVLIDGPSAEHELVLQGRLSGQAPDIDPVVYLTGCDPSDLRPGALISATIVGARGYDLVAQPEAGPLP
jgi:ribosomal protein S12 methylthiotransferase